MRNCLLERKVNVLNREVIQLLPSDQPSKRSLSSCSNSTVPAKRKSKRSWISCSKSSVAAKQKWQDVDSASENGTMEMDLESWQEVLVSQSASKNIKYEVDLSRPVKRNIARFFIENGIDSSAASSTAFRTMVDAIIARGGSSGFEIPSCDELSSLIQDEMKDIHHYVKEKIGMMKTMRRVLSQANTITKFIYSDDSLLRLVKEHTHGRDLIMSSRIKSTIPFMTLENIVTESENLMIFFYSSTWKTSNWAHTAKGRELSNLVEDPTFWTEASLVLNATIPLIEKYRRAMGTFGEKVAVDDSTKIPPVTWWSLYGGQCPELQKFAIRILSLTCCGALRYNLRRSSSEQLRTQGRECVEQERLNDLMFVEHNSRLQHSLSVNNNNNTNSNFVLEHTKEMNDFLMVVKQELNSGWDGSDLVMVGEQELNTKGGDSAWTDTDEAIILRGVVSSFEPQDEPPFGLVMDN
ncbi:hAT transposon superfamily [Thalictrum thalictroides]|uniref:HAT transposon superfamily n=1 Tax=Thalictrum thalictroides TaxID=46969 RepID=A0A7J6V852_THATH|nr:hAT transposon superfamily [Thalictrum thalictroides]